MNFNIRHYQPEDKRVVLALFRLNTPNWFAAEEEKDLIDYLDTEREDYFLIEDHEIVIGCGGINYFPTEQLARISWDFFHPEQHGKGFGSILLKHRLEKLNSNPEVETVVVRTSQHAWKFYEKHGFQLIQLQKDFWAPGFDLYLMELSIGSQNKFQLP